MVEVKMTMENQEEVLDALDCFEKKPSDDIPPLLEQYLRQIAKTGETLFPWQKLKSLFITKLDRVMKKFNQDMATEIPKCPNVDNTKFEEMRERILETVEQFQGAPFTIQRLCELLTEPNRHYSRSDKFLRGIEKNVLVVSTVDPFGRKIVSENRNMVNGLDMNGYNGGQGDAPSVTQYSAFPSSPLTNLPAEKNSVMKITEQCDEMPEAENEKILKDIMETEKSQTHDDSIPQEETTQPFSASTEAETTYDAEQEASDTTANNNANSETQNYFGKITSDSENSDNNVNDTSDGSYVKQGECDSTDMSRVHTENVQVSETVAEKEHNAEETPRQENPPEQEENLVNTSTTTSTCNVEETSSSEDVRNSNSDMESISSSVHNRDNHNTQEIQSSDSTVNTQTNDITSTDDTQASTVDTLATSGNQVPPSQVLDSAECESSDNGATHTVTGSSNITCESSNSENNFVQSSTSCQQDAANVKDTEGSIRGDTNSAVRETQDESSSSPSSSSSSANEEICVSNVVTNSTVTDQSDANNMDVDSSSVVRSAESVQHQSSENTFDEHRTQVEQTSSTSSSETPMEED